MSVYGLLAGLYRFVTFILRSGLAGPCISKDRESSFDMHYIICITTCKMIHDNMTHSNYTNDFPIKNWTGQYSHILYAMFETLQLHERLPVMVLNNKNKIFS